MGPEVDVFNIEVIPAAAAPVQPRQQIVPEPRSSPDAAMSDASRIREVPSGKRDGILPVHGGTTLP
jgi:hypothetical protein